MQVYVAIWPVWSVVFLYRQTTRAAGLEWFSFFGVMFLVGSCDVKWRNQPGATGVSLLPPGYGEGPMCTEFFMSIIAICFESNELFC